MDFRPDKISLSIKFALAVGLILFVFCSLFSVLLYYYLKNQLIADFEEKVLIIMNYLKAVGGYVRESLRPAIFQKLHELNMRDDFIIEAMSSTHVSHRVMERFNRDFQNYRFYRVSDNPTNPKNKADSFHSAMIHYFRNTKDKQPLWKGMVTSDSGKELIYVRPIYMEEGCLRCHGSPEDAPYGLIKKYGTSGGFHRKVGDVIGVESVSVSIDYALANVKRKAIDTFIFGLSTLGVLYLAIYGIFRQLVSKPLKSLSETFTKIIEGKESLKGDLSVERYDEIGELTYSFNALARHLLDAQEQLKKTAALEKQMMETEKFSALGQLSAGVAHEINNPLGGIRLCFNNLISTNMDDETRKRHIELINSGLDRIQAIVRQLLDFAKEQPLSPSLVSLNTLLTNVLNLTDYTISKKGIMLVKELSEELPQVLADANKLEQVFLNLIINAIQAMDKGGTLTVKTWFDTKNCYVSITDTGHGIPDGIKARIYDPFFTTKGVKEGTGLGLTVSKAIVEQHNGAIHIDTKPGKTTFTVSLPLKR